MCVCVCVYIYIYSEIFECIFKYQLIFIGPMLIIPIHIHRCVCVCVCVCVCAPTLDLLLCVSGSSVSGDSENIFLIFFPCRLSRGKVKGLVDSRSIFAI